MPKISIVTISLNQAQYLEKCICSIRAQQYENLEYIVVDPGSTDGSREILRQQSDIITKTVLDPDSGPSDGLNKGFAVATGDIYGFLNADDMLLPGALSFVSNFFTERPEVDVISGAVRIMDEHDNSSFRRRTSDRFDLARYAAGICTICQQATFFRADAFRKAGGFNVENRATWDGELLVDMALRGCRFSTVNKVLAAFRIYPASITGSKRFYEKQAMEYEAMRKKMHAAGVQLYSPLKAKLMRLSYKLNVTRHLKYLLVRDVRSAGGHHPPIPRGSSGIESASVAPQDHCGKGYPDDRQ